ncbi:hypothetical protein FRC01_003145, partial [Tulasnella sp. 417]
MSWQVMTTSRVVRLAAGASLKYYRRFLHIIINGIEGLRTTTIETAYPDLEFRRVSADRERFLNSLPTIASSTGVTPTVVISDLSTESEEDDEDTGGSTKIEEGNVVAAQAAFWLLTTTSNREDAISAAYFLRKISKSAREMAFESSRAWQWLSPWACEAFDVWQSQPNERNQEVAELFGFILFHVATQSPEPFSQKDNRASPRQRRPNSFGQTFLQALELARITYLSNEPNSEEYIVYIAFIMTMITRGSAFGNYRWTRPLQLLSTGNPGKAADVLLGLWAIAVERSNREYTFWVPKSTLKGLLKVGE